MLSTGVMRHSVGDGRDGYQERLSAENVFILRSQVCKRITPIRGEEVDGRYKKEECPRERYCLQTSELERTAQDDWNSEFKGSKRERRIQEVSRVVRSHVTRWWDLDFTLKALRNNRRREEGSQEKRIK